MDVFIANYPYLRELYTDYYLPYSAYLAPLSATLLHTQSLFFQYVYPTLYPLYQLTHYAVRTLVSSVLRNSSSSSSSYSPSSSSTAAATDAVISFLALGILLVVSLRVLDYVRRQVLWWVGFLTTVATYLGLGALAVYVYNRGVEESVEDAATLLGLLLGWSQEGARKGGRLASEREWDAERMRRSGPGKGHSSFKRSRGGGW